MNKRKKALLLKVERLFAQNGISWNDIKRSAKEIVVFGSASVGLDRPNSDLDLLLVGQGKRFKSQQLDVVWKTKTDVASRRWLESELAGHIAKYGVWLQGEGDWVAGVRMGNRAIVYKRRLIVARAKALESAWRTLTVAYKAKHVIKLRRDLQRLEILIEKKAIPPTLMLDQKWKKIKNPKKEILLIIERRSQFRLLTAYQTNIFEPFWSKISV